MALSEEIISRVMYFWVLDAIYSSFTLSKVARAMVLSPLSSLEA